MAEIEFVSWTIKDLYFASIFEVKSATSSNCKPLFNLLKDNINSPKKYKTSSHIALALPIVYTS